MQLMPATAQAVARQARASRRSLPSLTADPAHNMRLGTAYLRRCWIASPDSLPLAVAAYNAGPHRVRAMAGRERRPARRARSTMLDWIELIPIAETRNYVQRVLENVVIYQGRRNETAATLLAQWTR